MSEIEEKKEEEYSLNENKKFCMRIQEQLYMELMVRLNFDEIRKLEFFKEVIRMYVYKDKDFLKVVDKIKDKVGRQQVRRRQVIEKLRKKEEEFNNRFILSKDEKDRLFDIMEKDLPSPDDLE